MLKNIILIEKVAIKRGIILSRWRLMLVQSGTLEALFFLLFFAVAVKSLFNGQIGMAA